MKCLFLTTSLIMFASSGYAQSRSYVSVEGALAWQARNDQRIPGNSGDQFSFADFKTGPFPVFRIYAGHIFDGGHEVRALYAPLELELDGQLGRPVRFKNSVFSPGVPTEGRYRFNSYRLTYAYHFQNSGAWKLALGFTAKIREAEVTLIQGALRESKTNVGFVPLLNFQASRAITAGWIFRFDLDGLAAPQGRAIDAGIFLERDLPWWGLSAFGGYRTVEGGADNDEVYNFAWIHYATLGFKGIF